jgi:hypothetical protein
MEHRGLDRAFDTLRDLRLSATSWRRRATAAFKFHLDLHLAKEDAHLYRIFRERVSVPDQANAVGVMAGVLPPDRHPSSSRMFPPSAMTTARP